MLNKIPVLQRMFGFKVRGVIHIGAHEGVEHELYNTLGIRRQVFIEPHPETFRRLAAHVPNNAEVRLLNIACGAKPGKATMYQTSGNDGASNSLLEPTNHLTEFPEIKNAGTVEIQVERLDDAIPGANLRPTDYNLLVLDVQGFELEVLRGGERTLNDNVDAVVCELQRFPLYKDACLAAHVDEFMGQHGFQRVMTQWMAASFGDGLYLRRPGLRQRFFGALGTLAYRARYFQHQLRGNVGAPKNAAQTHA